jgi:hypothetical protein
MLEDLRSILASHGRLSSPILDAAPRLVSSHKLKWRFGGLGRAYELIGYDWKKDLSKAKGGRRKIQASQMARSLDGRHPPDPRRTVPPNVN